MARVDTVGHFCTDIADALREKSGTSEPIQASAFDTFIASLPAGLTTEQYMRLSDLCDYPNTPNEADYTQEEIDKVDALVEHFDSLVDYEPEEPEEVEQNGE